MHKTNSEQETIQFGKELAGTFQGGDIVLLHGDLGAGKTTLTKGMATYFDIQDVTSPTFGLMHVYQLNHKSVKQLVHIDCYRLESEQELIDIGVEDYLGDENTVCIIEWPEKIPDLLSKYKTRAIKLSFGESEDERTIVSSR